jgi:GAF domain-containing protein
MGTAGDTDLLEDTGQGVEELHQMVVVLARALRVKDARLQPTLDAVVSAAAETTGFDAGLVLVSGGVLLPQATNGAAPHQLDRVQQQLGAGPCIQAAQDQTKIVLGDTRTDDRWPQFCRQAQNVEVLSMVCLPLWVDERCLGTLSLYAHHAAAFTERDERTAILCATLAAAALADAQRAEQLRTALANRDVIGQAKGILMERHKLSAVAAFDLLSRVSQTRNRKLVVVAAHLVETGELLGGAESVR